MVVGTAGNDRERFWSFLNGGQKSRVRYLDEGLEPRQDKKSHVRYLYKVLVSVQSRDLAHLHLRPIIAKKAG